MYAARGSDIIARMQTVGLLGGTFDPIHFGHLAIAEEVRWALGLDRVLVIPAAHQPLKPDGHCAAAPDRLRMCELAVAHNARLDVCDLEIHRSGPSYTVDTLEALHNLYPATAFRFIIGADAVASLHLWHRITDVLRLCRFVVVGRPQQAAVEPVVEIAGVPFLFDVVPGPMLDISATVLRRRVRQGLPIRYQVPDEVVDYIATHHLYEDCG
ncbi:MAG: nicotinate-nucleotide adenylyltransferase [Herpetosiphon sp.]